MKSFLQTFSSVKLAIFLLIVITLASILGTLVPQNRSPEAYRAKYGEFSGLLMGLEITRLYQSWWYISFLFLFGLNTAVCTLTRLSPKCKLAFKPSVYADTKRMLSLNPSAKIKKPGNAEAAQKNLRDLLKRKHYRIREEVRKGARYILARKKLMGIFGSDIVHAGILIILFGGILSGLGGFRTNLNIVEGSTAGVPQADFQIRLDKFTTEYYPSGAVKDWKSTLTILNSGQEQITKTIEVNHPLSYRGFVFYQSSYGWDWNKTRLVIRVQKPGEDAAEQIRIPVGKKYTLSGGKTEVIVRRFIPDFVIAEDKRAATRSLQPNNPAVYLESRRSGKVIFSGWIFAKFPEFSQSRADEDNRISFILEDIHAPQYSGIQVAKDPGTNAIWAGCTVLMLGLLAAFYWPSRTLRFRIKEADSHTEIIAGGQAKKNGEEFQQEFKEIMSDFEETP